VLPALLLAPEVIAAIGGAGALAGVVGYFKGNSDGKTEALKISSSGGAVGAGVNWDIILISVAVIGAGYLYFKTK